MSEDPPLLKRHESLRQSPAPVCRPAAERVSVLRCLSPTTTTLLVVAGLAGAGLAAQARVNGELSVRLGSPFAAAAVNVVLGLTVVTAALVVRRIPLRGVVPSAPTTWWHWIGGLCALSYVCAVVITTPRLGVSLVVVSTAAGITSASLFADRLGLGLAGKHPVAGRRLAGAAIAMAAVAMSSSQSLVGLREWSYVGLAVAGGFALGCQQPINSRLSGVLGDAGLAALVSFSVGSVAVIMLAVTDPPIRAWPAEPVLYLGGLFAAAYVLVAIPIVGRVGALRLSLATMTGQLLGAAVVDALAPTGGHRLTAVRLVGVLVAVVGVGLTTARKGAMR